MIYIIIIVAIITLVLHWHYYRWGILTNSINYPKAYQSKFGISIVIISKLSLLLIIFLFYNWYYIFIPLITFFLLKLTVAYISICYETKGYIKSLKINKKRAKENASREIKEYYRKSSKLI
jgi:hypothetical protein